MRIKIQIFFNQKEYRANREFKVASDKRNIEKKVIPESIIYNLLQ